MCVWRSTFVHVQIYLVTSSDSVECCRRSLVLCPSDEIILAHIVFSCSSGECADKPRDPGLVSLGSEGLLCIGGEGGDLGTQGLLALGLRGSYVLEGGPRDPGLVSLGPEGLLCIGGEGGRGGGVVFVLAIYGVLFNSEPLG